MDDFRETMLQSDMTTQRCADWLGVSVRTVQRYCLEGAPLMAHRALAPFAGELPGWHGFKIRGLSMLTPCGAAHRNQIDNIEWFARLQYQRGWTAAMDLPKLHFSLQNFKPSVSLSRFVT